MTIPFRTCAVAAVLWISLSAAAAGKLELVTPALIVISTDTPAATGTIVVRNSGDAAVTPSLVTGTFFTDPGNEPLAVIAKFPPAEAIEPGATASLAVELTNVTEPGYAKAELRDREAKLGELRIVKKVFAFNVAPVGYDAKEPFPLHLVYGEPGTVTLLSSDAFTHSFVWSLRDGTRELARGTVPMLRPNATVDLRIPSESASFLQKLEGTLKERQSAGRLILRAVPRGAADGGEYWVAKEVPLRVRRTAGDGATRDLKQMGWILLLLLAGGLTSLGLMNWVPSTLKKMDVMARIGDLTWKINQLRRTPPTLRVMLGVHRNQLRERLKSRWVLSLDFPQLAAECERRANALHRRIELVQEIEHLLVEIEREWESGTLLGPTVLQRAAELLQKAIVQLQRGELPDDDMRTLELQVAQAEQILNSTAEDRNLVKEIVARAEELQKRTSDLQWWADAASDLEHALKKADAEQIRWPSDVWKLDYAVAKMEIAAGVAASHEKDLLRFLKLHSLEAFEEAVGKARQIREGIAPGELMEKLRSKEARIIFHPEKPRGNAIVFFDLELLDPALNSATARRTLTCRWDFGDGLHEDGWHVSHYFPVSKTYSVKATVTDRQGADVAIDPVALIVQPIERDRVGARTRIELIRLGVALLVVLLGLVAGAKEQLVKLDFVAALVALFLLGVTADQIKNLLAPRTPAGEGG